MEHNIKKIRKQHGDTLKELAKKINYDYSNLSKIERGIYTPSLTLLNKISNIYNVDLHYLLELDRNNKYTKNEEDFIHDIDLESQELLQKYNLILDGKSATQDELELVIQVIRKLREALEKVKK
ncbi:transcriptional regulator [Bacillus thuringiensis serovar shandongiensis]|uniref:helix-turn-helix domain-containing protein n=1 Tax=Bacillus toyonensis TaxID=155322 RepID=UPI000B43C7DE|nr:helix-turn-helix transcriptional regulator [Bacillus toyonensis]MEC2394042.1 helix-turn-helix transcriptional regulator [Bacillus toyonensis]OTX38515.1 transcriptional regulator [Bacillus thuringiensis serovar malayensis]OUB07116.1 transcriptional regulator [Bacillus thuringiensis serovar shandongiensis]